MEISSLVNNRRHCIREFTIDFFHSHKFMNEKSTKICLDERRFRDLVDEKKLSIISFASVKKGVPGLSCFLRKLKILELSISDIVCINLKDIHVPIKVI